MGRRFRLAQGRTYFEKSGRRRSPARPRARQGFLCVLYLSGAHLRGLRFPRRRKAAHDLGGESMDAMTLIGVFTLALIILGGISASLLAKRNDEMQSGRHH
jgi:hypothetical protein